MREDDATRLFAMEARRYTREIFPTKTATTRRDNEKELANLMKVCAHMPIDAIAPMHIREYLDIRGQVAKFRANREKALFSHIFNKARNGATPQASTLARASKASRKQGGTGTSLTWSLTR